MIRLLIIMLMLPLVACSQNDLGFWEGTPEKLDGCKMYLVVSRSSDPVIQFTLTYVDCYGNEQSRAYQANGSSYSVCSMETPISSAPILVQSITQTGWCTGPVGSTWNFWLDAVNSSWITVRVQDVAIYSSDSGGANRNLLYSTSNPVDIYGEDNAVIINDTYTSQSYYIIRVTANKSDIIPDAYVYIRPGSSQSLRFGSTSFQTKEIVIEKRQIYLQYRQI